MKKRIFLIVTLLICGAGLFAQSIIFPTVSQLQKSLHQLLAYSVNGYSSIDGGPAGTDNPDYRIANFHIVANARNQLYLSTPATGSYSEFFQEGINKDQASSSFQKWKNLFEQALPEFIFLSHREDTYGDAFYYYNTAQTDMFVLEVYYNPVEKTWSISLNLYHPTKGDKENIAKKNKPKNKDGVDVSLQQKAIQKSMLGLLNDRANKFQAYRGIDLSGKDGDKMFGVKGTDYNMDPGPVEFIEETAQGETTYFLTAAGFDMPILLAIAYKNLLTDELKKQGYSLKTEEGVETDNYSILFNGESVSQCRLEKTKMKVSIVILGK
ncbi:MAG: hypothetical protein ABI091_09710 [Ferruginibacter sp.]